MAIQRQLTHVEIDKDLVLAGAQDNALPPPTATHLQVLGNFELATPNWLH